jgi:hypothetical protein
VNLRFSLRVAIRSWQDRLEPLFSIANPAPGPSADAWPGLIQLSREAIAKVRPGIGVFALQKEGYAMVTSHSQQDIVDAHNIPVARKAPVALMDTHVGPKH